MTKGATMNMSCDGVAHRARHAFVARGRASRDEAGRIGEYIDAANVRAELERLPKAAPSTKAVD